MVTLLTYCIKSVYVIPQSVLSDWLSRYQSNPEKAMLELIQYFVRCCGCNAVVSQKDFQTQEASTVIRALTENFAEVMEE